MEHEFKKRGYNMVSGGTDTHLLLLDLRNKVYYFKTRKSMALELNEFWNWSTLLQIRIPFQVIKVRLSLMA